MSNQKSTTIDDAQPTNAHASTGRARTSLASTREAFALAYEDYVGTPPDSEKEKEALRHVEDTADALVEEVRELRAALRDEAPGASAPITAVEAALAETPANDGRRADADETATTTERLEDDLQRYARAAELPRELYAITDDEDIELRLAALHAVACAADALARRAHQLHHHIRKGVDA